MSGEGGLPRGSWCPPRAPLPWLITLLPDRGLSEKDQRVEKRKPHTPGTLRHIRSLGHCPLVSNGHVYLSRWLGGKLRIWCQAIPGTGQSLLSVHSSPFLPLFDPSSPNLPTGWQLEDPLALWPVPPQLSSSRPGHDGRRSSMPPLSVPPRTWVAPALKGSASPQGMLVTRTHIPHPHQVHSSASFPIAGPPAQGGARKASRALSPSTAPLSHQPVRTACAPTTTTTGC